MLDESGLPVCSVYGDTIVYIDERGNTMCAACAEEELTDPDADEDHVPEFAFSYQGIEPIDCGCCAKNINDTDGGKS